MQATQPTLRERLDACTTGAPSSGEPHPLYTMNYHDLDKLKAAMEDLRQTCSYQRQRKRLANTSLVLPRLAVVAVFFVTSAVLKCLLHSFALGALAALLGTVIAIIL